MLSEYKPLLIWISGTKAENHWPGDCEEAEKFVKGRENEGNQGQKVDRDVEHESGKSLSKLTSTWHRRWKLKSKDLLLLAIVYFQENETSDWVKSEFTTTKVLLK